MAEITITGTFPHVCHNNAWDEDLRRYEQLVTEYERAVAARAQDETVEVPDEPVRPDTQPTRELLGIQFSDGECSYNAYVEVGATEDEIVDAIRATLKDAQPPAVQAGQSLQV